MTTTMDQDFADACLRLQRAVRNYEQCRTSAANELATLRQQFEAKVAALKSSAQSLLQNGQQTASDARERLASIDDEIKQVLKDKQDAMHRCMEEHKAASSDAITEMAAARKEYALLMDRVIDFEQKAACGRIQDMNAAEAHLLTKLLGIDALQHDFLSHCVDGTRLRTMTEAEMSSVLGITALGDRRRLMRAVRKMVAGVALRLPSLMRLAQQTVSQVACGPVRQAQTAKATADDTLSSLSSSSSSSAVSKTHLPAVCSSSSASASGAADVQLLPRWSVAEVGMWAQSKGLSKQVLEAIQRHRINGEALFDLGDNDLETIGILDSDQRILLKQALDKLKSQAGDSYVRYHSAVFVAALPPVGYDHLESSSAGLECKASSGAWFGTAKEQCQGHDPSKPLDNVTAAAAFFDVDFAQDALDAADYEDDVPFGLICPISCGLMTDPVIAVDGFTYDRPCIEAWFSTGNRTSPMTREVISTLLIPNLEVFNQIQEFKHRRHQLHP